jgi:hypothetical protein
MAIIAVITFVIIAFTVGVAVVIVVAVVLPHYPP